MQTVRVRTTQNVLIDYPLASIGDRIIGHMIDRIVLIFYSVAMAVAFVSAEMDSWVPYIILIGFPWMFYSVLFEIFMNGQTPGKQVMKVKVVRLNGTQPSVGDYLLRWIFSFIDFYVFSGVIAVLFVALGGKGQRLGDIAAGTTVVKLTEQREVTAEEVFVTASETHVPTFNQVMQLTDRDIELIQRALEANRDQGNMLPVTVITEKIKTMLNIHTELTPEEFLETVVKDYQTLTTGR